LEGEESGAKEIDVDVVQKRGEPFRKRPVMAAFR
jgi:hypothetical protein